MIHHATLKDVEMLEGIFAYFTPTGWIVPDWLKLMRDTVRS